MKLNQYFFTCAVGFLKYLATLIMWNYLQILRVNLETLLKSIGGNGVREDNNILVQYKKN